DRLVALDEQLLDAAERLQPPRRLRPDHAPVRADELDVDRRDVRELIDRLALPVGEHGTDGAGHAPHHRLEDVPKRAHCCTTRSLRLGAPSRLAALVSRARKTLASARALIVAPRAH